MIKIGCCGFPVARKKYFRAFSVVEVQLTFYQIPNLSLARKWRAESPQDFEYTMKAWQLITHEPKSPTYKKLKLAIPKSKENHYGSFKPTEEVWRAWEKTREIADTLSARVIVFQCPPSFIPTEENKKNLKQFFSRIDRNKYIPVWEPRGKWEPKDINPLCKELDLVHVVDPFTSSSMYGESFYYRLHGRGGYRYKYTKEDLEHLQRLIPAEKSGYVMFNNIYMFEDAAAFKELVE
ncbi:MAG: DUF72 domain-containing protein [Nitrospirota bacterium]